MAARGSVEREQTVVVAGQVQNRRQVDLEKLFRDRKRALPVEPPDIPVGQDAPAQPAIRQVVGPAQIAQHLGGRRRRFAGLRRPAVERPAPSLRLDDGEAELVALPFLKETVGPVLALLIGEQEAVRHIHHSLGREVLLAQPFGPAELPQHGPDQVVLGLALVGRPRGREAGRKFRRALLPVRPAPHRRTPPSRPTPQSPCRDNRRKKDRPETACRCSCGSPGLSNRRPYPVFGAGCGFSSTGPPASFQPLKPPSIWATSVRPISCTALPASALRQPAAQ